MVNIFAVFSLHRLGYRYPDIEILRKNNGGMWSCWNGIPRRGTSVRERESERESEKETIEGERERRRKNTVIFIAGIKTHDIACRCDSSKHQSPKPSHLVDVYYKGII